MSKRKSKSKPANPVPVPTADREVYGEPVAAKSAGDTFLSLNGFDEIAIAATFGSHVTDLRKLPLTFLRALVFVDQRRQGLNDKDAHKHALSLSIGHVQAYFPDDVDDLDADDPETPEGKAD